MTDIRTGLFPLAMAVAFTLLATCPQAVLRMHERPPRMVTVGGWWTTIALLGPAGFFAGVAIGAMLGLDEETLGGYAILPVASMAFGILTLPIATTILALAVRRSGHLPSRVFTSLLVAGWVPPVLMVVGGLAEGTRRASGPPLWRQRSSAPGSSLGLRCVPAHGHRRSGPGDEPTTGSVAASRASTGGVSCRTGDASGLERARRRSTLPLVALLEQAVELVEVHATTVFVELPAVIDHARPGGMPKPILRGRVESSSRA